MKPESVVAIAALQAAIKRLGISVAAKTLPISMAIEVGNFLIEKVLAGGVDVYDGTGAVDEFMFDYFKTLTDDAATADDAVYAFNKVLNDTPGVTDIEVLQFYKSLADVATFSDTHYADFSKELVTDISAIGDHAYAYVKKVKEDLATVADAEYQLFVKALTEAPSLVDAIDTVTFFKNSQGVAGFTDTETFAFAKYLIDNVNATDDIDGAASILDDQEMQYHKNTTNLATLTDEFLRIVAYKRVFADDGDVTDNDVLGVGKYVSNVANPLDATEYALNKQRSDLAKTNDSTILDVFKLILDTPRATDIEVLSIGKTLADTTTRISESKYIYTGKVQNTNMVFSDEHASYLGKLFTDVAGVSDNLAVHLTLAPFTDTLSAIDNIQNSTNKLNIDTTSFTDTGSLRSQSYSDFTFFEEDFVGASRTF